MTFVEMNQRLAQRHIAESVEGKTQEDIAGRPTLVAQNVANGKKRCQASVVVGQFALPHVFKDVVEMATIDAVVEPSNPADVCDAARRMAAAVWPKLPGR